ncbi:MAG: serine hydrolase domain-containing protein [Woeseiaceae bacterium]
MIHRSEISAVVAAVAFSCFAFSTSVLAKDAYFPPANNWERRAPERAGIDTDRLRAAVQFAVSNESEAPRDLETNHPLSWGKEPFDTPLGPFRERGPQTGIIVKNGYIVAEWGDIKRVDMTFSVSKSFLSSTVGLAFDAGLIRDVNDAVGDYFAPIVLPPGDGESGEEEDGVGVPNTRSLFESTHNRKITWDHLLRQTSDWQGTLWGKPDWADRPGDDVAANRFRERNEPGSVYKYNDVRVNLLALCALQVWRRPLPQVLKQHVMDPIGASNTWRWHGYENSWVTIDGQMVNSVSGGGHWGGGMHISALDQARFGYLTLNKGRWKDRQVLSEEWLTMAEMPGKANRDYGFMNWFLNTGRRSIPAAPESAFSHRGAGTNLVYVDRQNDLVVVARWIQRDAIAEFIEKVLAALP